MARGAIQLVETFFKKYFWMVNLGMISIIALMIATGVNSLLAGVLAPLTVLSPESSAGESDGLDHFQDPNALGIVELFEVEEVVTEVPVEEPGEEPEEEPEEEELIIAEGDCVPATIQAMLVGTVADELGSWGHGIVQDQTTNRTIIARRGSEIAGTWVTRIERNRVFIDNEGIEQCLIAGQEPGTAPVAANESSSRSSRRERTSRPSTTPTETPAVAESSASTGTDSMRDSIRRVSATQYEIDREGVNRVLDNPRLMQRDQPEFQQSFDDGRPNGIRLTQIPSGSIVSSLGIRQGDVIMDVNGQRVTTPQRAMELYEALQTESHLEITVQRRGRTRTLSYDIR